MLTSDHSCIASIFGGGGGERKFYAGTHVKNMRQWKLTLRDEFFKIPYSRNY